MPSFPIIDTHVHFWDRDQVPIAWTRAAPPIDRTFLWANYEEDRGEVAVEGVVFVEANVEAGHHLAEVDWVARLEAEGAPIWAIVAHASLERGAAVRDDLAALAARPLVRGVRRLIQGEDAEALCADPDFRAGVKSLPEHGLHFEICITHDQLEPALDLARACPEVAFVLDHIAKPGIAAGLREPWWTRIAGMAELGNVTCKLSGVATEADHRAWTDDQLLPYIDRVLDAFGPGRVMFGSDWPVMRLATDLPRWVALVDRASEGWPEADRRRLYVDNAKQFYRL